MTDQPDFEQLVCCILISTIADAVAHCMSMGYSPDEAAAYAPDVIGYWVEYYDDKNPDYSVPTGRLTLLNNTNQHSTTMWCRDRMFSTHDVRIWRCPLGRFFTDMSHFC